MHLTIRFLKYVAILIFLKEVVALSYNQFCSQTLSFYIFPPSFSLLLSSLSPFFFSLLFGVSKVCVLYSTRLDCTEFGVYVFSPFFFFFLLVNSKIMWFYYAGDKKHCSRTIHALFTGPTTLFTHLKIILLQCFQFSVFSFSKNKLYPNGPI